MNALVDRKRETKEWWVVFLNARSFISTFCFVRTRAQGRPLVPQFIETPGIVKQIKEKETDTNAPIYESIRGGICGLRGLVQLFLL